MGKQFKQIYARLENIERDLSANDKSVIRVSTRVEVLVKSVDGLTATITALNEHLVIHKERFKFAGQIGETLRTVVAALLSSGLVVYFLKYH